MILRKTGLVVQVSSGRFLFFIKYTLWFHMVMLASVDGSFFWGANEQRSRGRNGEEAMSNMSFAASPLVRARFLQP